MISMTRDEKKVYDDLMASGDVEALREYLRILEQKKQKSEDEDV